MNASRESVPRTILVATLVALVCSVLVSSVVYFLRPYELAFGALERNRAVLEAAGRIAPAEAVGESEVVARFLDLEARVVDLSSGTFSDAADPATYDFRAALDDPGLRVDIPAAEDAGRLGTRPRYMTVYFALAEAGRPERIVLPVFARGMWSTIYGFVALEGDFRTIAGLSFYEHGETPGIGDRILDPQWLATWSGKRLYAPDGALRFRITSAAGDLEPEYRVDSITGATVTVAAVGDAMRYWFSAHGYGPLLERLRESGY